MRDTAGSRHEIQLLSYPLGEAGQEVGGAVDVVERDHLDRAVHVAVGYAQGGGHARPVDLDGVRVGARRPPLGGKLVRDRMGLGAVDQQVDTANTPQRSFRASIRRRAKQAARGTAASCVGWVVPAVRDRWMHVCPQCGVASAVRVGEPGRLECATLRPAAPGTTASSSPPTISPKRPTRPTCSKQLRTREDRPA